MRLSVWKDLGMHTKKMVAALILVCISCALQGMEQQNSPLRMPLDVLSVVVCKDLLSRRAEGGAAIEQECTRLCLGFGSVGKKVVREGLRRFETSIIDCADLYGRLISLGVERSVAHQKIISFLQTSGEMVIELTITPDIESDVARIVRWCPHLECLSLRRGENDEKRKEQFSNCGALCELRELENLVLEDCVVPDAFAYAIIASCHKLTCLSLMGYTQFSGNAIACSHITELDVESVYSEQWFTELFENKTIHSLCLSVAAAKRFIHVLLGWYRYEQIKKIVVYGPGGLSFNALHILLSRCHNLQALDIAYAGTAFGPGGMINLYSILGFTSVAKVQLRLDRTIIMPDEVRKIEELIQVLAKHRGVVVVLE